MKTTCKEVKDKIKKHIGEYYTPEELKENAEGLKCPYYPTDYAAIKQMVEGGSFLIYYNEVIDFLNGLGINPENKKYDEIKSWELYCHLIAREGQHIIKKAA